MILEGFDSKVHITSGHGCIRYRMLRDMIGETGPAQSKVDDTYTLKPSTACMEDTELYVPYVQDINSMQAHPLGMSVCMHFMIV